MPAKGNQPRKLLEVTMTVHRVLVVALAMVITLVATGASAQQPTSPAKAKPVPAGLDEYKIGPEDVLAISVWKNEPMSRVLPVRPDGMISLPLLDDIMAAGLTPMELRNVLAQKLAEYVPSPAVTVIVNDVRSFKVSVIGEVVRPARYELKSRTSVLDVLALAGGFNQFAARTRIVVLRQDGDKKTRIPFNYNRVTSSGADEENLYLRPGDIVLVP
jgi:polysaccharide biosynthesis/export protein